MGLLDRIKNFKDVGGVKLEVSGPSSFRWSDGVLPLTLTFHGRGDQGRMATEVEVEVTQRIDSDRETMFRYIVAVRFDVPAGQTVVRSMEVPLVLDDRPVDPSHLEQVPGWASGLIRRTGVGVVGFTGSCKLEAKVVYEGFKRPGSATTDIEAQ